MPVAKTTAAVVMVGKRKTELRELPIPELSPDAGLLKIEAAGTCGADVGFFNRELSPRVLGHENVGTIAAIGEIAAQRWGVQEGDRVVLEEYLPCGHCRFCRSSEFRLCMESDAQVNPNALRYGSTPLTVEPSLWGGYSQFLYMHPNTVIHKLDAGVPAVQATLALPLANGYEWAYVEGNARPGSTVVIIGPGQQGLGCVLAAKQAGAANIIVTGLRRDTERLRVAAELGADHTICVEDEDALEKITELTGGELADTVVDTAAGNESTLSLALDAVRKAGRIVSPAATMRPLKELDFYKITRKYVTVKGMRGHSYGSVEWAIETISSGRYPLELLCSLEVGLDDVEQAILGTAGELSTPVIHAAVVPAG
jgi:Threonine dehydrogenase and related Zn-dependent dehydrogenases